MKQDDNVGKLSCGKVSSAKYFLRSRRQVRNDRADRGTKTSTASSPQLQMETWSRKASHKTTTRVRTFNTYLKMKHVAPVCIVLLILGLHSAALAHDSGRLNDEQEQHGGVPKSPEDLPKPKEQITVATNHQLRQRSICRELFCVYLCEYHQDIKRGLCYLGCMKNETQAPLCLKLI
ncbi:uncharacterized protein LOC135394933 isoform X2 [Ornithodoros turicata]|uniref:uncharacterized protein LOC135394933 isoform X2 n=1 Tax=Ornithodoros turicata TaxID=34597 RepID=UPI00313973E6